MIAPFWLRLPKFFIYPFQPRSLILMFTLALAGVIFGGPGFLKGLFRIAIWGVLLKYAYASLKDTSIGNLAPPKITLESISDKFQVVFKQLGIYLAIFLVFAKINQVAGIPLAVLFGCFAILSIPAMITVLAVTDSFICALNPLIFVRMAWRIGWGYLLMYLFLLLLLFAPATVGTYIFAFLPKGLHLFLLSFTKSYYTIISYHLMGYVMLQYHEEIGWDVDFDDDLASEDDESEVGSGNELLNRVDMLIKDGQIDEAISLIKEETEGNITDLDLAERYYKLLKIKQQVPEILQHSKIYLDLLTKKNDGDKACRVYSDCVSTDNQFAPTPMTLFKIGGFFNERGKSKEAINAYNRFIKANPSNPLIPKACFLGANILNEKLNATQKAAQILNAVIKKYPDHDMIPHVRNYLKGMAL